MANVKEIQKRIKSINDTMKITKAMYMISSIKLRKAKEKLEETEPFSMACRNRFSRIWRNCHLLKTYILKIVPKI